MTDKEKLMGEVLTKVFGNEPSCVNVSYDVVDLILADRKDQEDKMRGMFEAEIEKANDHIMFLLPMAKGYAYPTNIKANLQIIKNAEEFIKHNEKAK